MTNLEKVRNVIDDHVSIGLGSEMSVGGVQLFQLNSRNVWNLTVKDKDGNVVAAEGYTLFPQSGQIKGTFPEGELTFEYEHAAFTDDEITDYLTELGGVTATAVACVRILLASASKRFDYKAGIKDIKASQVFDNLKELLASLQDQLTDEDNSSVGLFVTRIHPAYEPSLPRYRRDVSRVDL